MAFDEYRFLHAGWKRQAWHAQRKAAMFYEHSQYNMRMGGTDRASHWQEVAAKEYALAMRVLTRLNDLRATKNRV